MLRWKWWSCRNTRRLQTRVICWEPRSLPRNQRFGRPVRQNPFTSTRPTQTLLRLISLQHSTPNRKKRSSSSSVRTGTSSHGSLMTCLEFPGDWLSIALESTQQQNQSRNIFGGPPSRRERPSVKKWLDCWRQGLSERYSTPSGSLTSSWFLRRTSRSECAWISSTSIGPARKIIFLSLALIKLLTRPRDARDCLF